MDQIATFNTIIKTAEAGKMRSAFLSRRGSEPAIDPMMRELTASPTQPQVMTKPSAVPVICGKAWPVIANVVGKTGAMETPAMKTSANAVPGLLVWSIRNVVIAMAIDAPRV